MPTVNPTGGTHTGRPGIGRVHGTGHARTRTHTHTCNAFRGSVRIPCNTVARGCVKRRFVRTYTSMSARTPTQTAASRSSKRCVRTRERQARVCERRCMYTAVSLVYKWSAYIQGIPARLCFLRYANSQFSQGQFGIYKSVLCENIVALRIVPELNFADEDDGDRILFFR